MKAIIISIGDELLIGQTINTNAAWLGQQLSIRGIQIIKTLTIADSETEILNALTESVRENQLVIITGGLGPTKDDITKHTLCKFFNTTLILNETVLAHVTQFFAKRNRPMLEVNTLQATVPANSEVLFNRQGTAPGMWFAQNKSIVISLPGVPYEMQSIMLEEAFPKLQKHLGSKTETYFRTVLTQGIGESFLAEKLKDWETDLRSKGFSLAYLPSPGVVKLRITAPEGQNKKQEIETYINQLYEQIPRAIFGEEDETLAGVVMKLFTTQSKTLSVVESCTAGQLSADITAVSGASQYFMGGIVAYSNELKSQLVGVNSQTIIDKGAVSQSTVIQMAEGGRQKLNTDYCVAISGVAGPTGGTEYNPVGSIWIAIAGPNRTFSKHHQFGDHRGRNIQMAVASALNMLRCEILGINKD